MTQHAGHLRMIAGGGALALALGCLVVAVDFWRYVAMLEDREPGAVESADGIVALTGGADRISDALELLASGRARRLLITGVNQTTHPSALSASLPRTAQLLACCIDLDRNALNTVGNALEAARWVRLHNFRSIIVVTSSYHMPRTLMELRRVLPDTELISYPVIARDLDLDQWWRHPSTVKLLVFEYAKYRSAGLGLRLERPTATTVQAQL